NVSIRALVCGRPIFDDEVRHACYQELLEATGLPEPQRTARQTEIFNRELDRLIDREVILHDADGKLKNNPKAVEKLRAIASKEFDKQVRTWRTKSKAKSDEEFRDILRNQGVTLEAARRQFERSFLAMEYMKSRIFPLIEHVGNFIELREY